LIKIFPPNPGELLASSQLDLLFATVREEYDYVIIDTAPVGLVADAYRINQFTDAVIYVTRANYTYKSSLPEIESLYKNNKLQNLSIVFNAALPKKRYGGGYYHSYYVEEEGNGQKNVSNKQKNAHSNK
jgi:Mrp family chromosome partitioning ATPase